jgi:hypothetical protein
VILPPASRPGIGAHGFGFAISWATNATIVVEAATDATTPTWSPISTHTLRYAAGSTEADNGWIQIHDPGWKDYLFRLYRVRLQ